METTIRVTLSVNGSIITHEITVSGKFTVSNHTDGRHDSLVMIYSGMELQAAFNLSHVVSIVQKKWSYFQP